MKIKRLAINSISLSLVRPVSLLINLAAFPVLIKAYGKEAFGIYTLAATFAASVTAFDFGLQSNLVRVVAESRATGDVSDAKRVMAFAAKIYWLTGAAFASIALVAGLWLGWLFKVPDEMQRQFLWAALHGGLASALIIRLKVEEAVLDAYEYHFVRNLMALVPAVGTLALLFAVRNGKASFEFFVSASFALLIVPGCANWVARHRLNLVSGPGAIDAAPPPGFVQKSVDTFVTQALAFLSLAGQQFFVGTVMGPAAVATFATATRPVFMLRIMTSQTALPMMPQIVSLLKLGKRDEAVRFMRNANSLILVIVVCIAAPVATCSELFFAAWMDDDVAQLARLSNIAILGLVVAGCTGVISRYFVFAGEPRRLLMIQWRCSLAFIVSAPFSLYLGGLESFLWVVAANYALVSMLLFREYVREAGVSWGEIYLAKTFAWLLLAFGVCLVGGRLAHGVPVTWPWIGVALVSLGLLLGGLAYLVFRPEIAEALRKSKLAQ